MAPDVLLVVMDTARADAFEPYGAPVGQTPASAALALRGAWAPVVHATANWTLPSHASLFSGRLPRALGIGAGPPLRRVLAANEHRLLAPVLRDEGWHTVAISANPFVSPVHGFGLGFDRFFDVTSARRSPGHGVSGRLRQAAAGLLADVDDGLACVEETAVTAVEEAPSDRPWFLFVNLMECHAPYLPPVPWNDLPWHERLRAADDVRAHQSHAAVVHACLGRHRVPATSLARMRHLYDRSISMMDAWLGRFVERLAARGRLSDTLVIVTSDHGENFGEGERLGHTLSVDERLLRVPLVAAGAGLDRTDLAAVRSIADVPRVIAEAVALDRHPWREPACPEGIAIAQNDGYSAVDPAFRALFHREWHLDADAVERLDRPLHAVVDGSSKLVREEHPDGWVARLHDLAADPLEEHDIAATRTDECLRLAALLDAAAERPLIGTSDDEDSPRPADPAITERLRVLGYL